MHRSRGAALWPQETFVDFEHSVNTAVKKLRKALEDSVQNQKFVVPKVGYRFLALVEWVTETSNDHPPRTDVASPITDERAFQLEGAKPLWLSRSVLAIAFMAAGTIALLLLYRSP